MRHVADSVWREPCLVAPQQAIGARARGTACAVSAPAAQSSSSATGRCSPIPAAPTAITSNVVVVSPILTGSCTKVPVLKRARGGAP